MSDSAMELQGVVRGDVKIDGMAPEGGAPSPTCATSLLDPGSLAWEDGSLREEVGERWRPKDLDNFFTRIYEYFKERGFTCMMKARATTFHHHVLLQ